MNERGSGLGRIVSSGVDREMFGPMDGVREHSEGSYPVELYREPDNGRLVVRAWNECGNNYTDVDLFDLIEWPSANPSILGESWSITKRGSDNILPDSSEPI